MIAGLYDLFQERWVSSKGGTVWLYSDPHFGDKELAAGVPGRPSDEEQIKMINSKVGKKDVLIILGDVGDVECAKKLKGYKVLIMGNHDAGKTNYKEAFDEIYEGALMIGEKLILSHEPVEILFALNLHGHVHDRRAKSDEHHINLCSDVINYTPVNFNQLMKSGPTSKIETIHRVTIDKATKRKKDRKLRQARL